MNKGVFIISICALAAGSAISAPPPHSAFPEFKSFENYDIRTQTDSNGSAEVHALIATGKRTLGSQIPNLRVEDNPFRTAPEIVDVTGATAALTGRSNAPLESVVRLFVSENAALYGLTPAQMQQLQVVADYSNPAGNLSWVEYEQRVNGIALFQGYFRAALTNDGRIWRTMSNLAPGLDYTRLPTAPKLSPTAAAAAAAKLIDVNLTSSDLRTLSVDQHAHRTTLSPGPFTEEIKIDLFYFSTVPGQATLAYSMVLWEPHDAYWILLDATDGHLLWRKNITQDQTQSVTYSIYDSESPTPLSPTTALPGSGIQGIPTTRSTLTLISELPAFDDLGWIPDGAGNAVTTGNNVDAGLDIDGSNGVDPNGRAVGAGRVFDFPYNPGGTPNEEPPTGTNYRMGTVTNLFFWSNRYHDILYQLGFTEQARNFQTNNFGRGGLGNDFVRAEAQDSSGTNSANFGTPADGSPPRMQMFIFTAPNPDRDTSIDGNVYIHELTHGTSNRLHANASGLATTMSGGMGEGWGDYYARCILSSADEDVNGLYPMGGYVTLNFVGPGGTTGTDNYYYGIRRFPYAVKTNVGGPGAIRPGQPHNPLTFQDMDTVLNNINDGAYNPSPSVIFTPNESHRIGEIWCLMILEMRARIITRMGWAAGNQRALQLVTDGMKLDPASPTPLQARDAILAADCASFGGEDEQDIWAGFATRGAGLSSTTTGGTTLASDIIDAFDVPNLKLGAVIFSDLTGNSNGFADPGETILLTVPLTNPFCGTPANNTTATIGGQTGNYGTIPAAGAVSQIISFTVPSNTACGTLLSIPATISSSLGPVTRSFTIVVGQPTFALNETFDSVVAPALPGGWTSTHTGSLANWVTSTTNPSSAPNDIFSNEITTAGSSEIVSPAIPIASANAQLSFRNLFNLQTSLTTAFDGLVLEISIPNVAGGAFQDILVAGGSFPDGGNGYNKTISAATNPLNGRQCWSGLSAGTTAAPAYITTTVNLPAAASGQSIQLKWRTGTDTGSVAGGLAGTRIDDVKVASSFTCSPVGPTPTPGPPTPTPTATPVTTPTVTPTPGMTPTPTASPIFTPTPTPTPVCITNPIVTTNADNGPGSLRQAIADACIGSTITFNIAQNLITLSSPLLAFRDVTISGPGAGQLSISGNDLVALFTITGQGTETVTLSGLSLVHGHSTGGGISYFGGGTLNIDHCVVNNNFSTTGGGGVYNGGAGRIVISDSTLDNNSAADQGGGVLNTSLGTVDILNSAISNNHSLTSNSQGSGGGISNSGHGTVNVTNSTISGNTVGTLGIAQGGGIVNSGNGSVRVINCTITDNHAEEGGGVSNTGGTFQIWNSIVAGNNAPLVGPDVRHAFVTLGHNLIGIDEGSTGFTAGINGDLVGTRASPIDPHLGPLANNGGSTLTHLLQSNSPAINGGDNAAITNPPFSGPPFFDQRGTGFPRILNVTVDIGAVEIDSITTPTPTPTIGPATHFAVTAPNAVSSGNPFEFNVTALDGSNNTVTTYGGTIHFTSSGGSILPADSGLVNGTGTFSATLFGPGILLYQIITATDTNNPSITGDSNFIYISKNPPTPTPTPTATPPPEPADALNLSTRLHIETENNVGIGGFIITGTDPRQMLLRAIGPSLSSIGVSDALADPIMELHGPNGFTTVTNDNWRDTQEAEIIATGIPPTNDLESAILVTLDPGAYTAVVSGIENGTGVGLVEIYDLSHAANSELSNISTRGFVRTESNVMIGGFILGAGTNSEVLIHGIGPSLTGFGISPALFDPTLELRDSNGTLIDQNDDCSVKVGPPNACATFCATAAPGEACMDDTLPPGAYTAILAGKDGGIGIGLLEIYNLH